MRFDLFEFVEGLIRGVVYFLYSIVETVNTIICHPVRGPVRLYRSSLRSDRRQVGGLTFLFLSLILLCLSFFGVSAQETRDNRPKSFYDQIAEVSSRIPQFDTDRMWPVILASLVATVAVDAVLRLILRWRLPRRRIWRRMMLSAAEYSLLWLVALGSLWPHFSYELHGTVGEPGATLLIIILFILAALPPAIILRRTTCRKYSPRRMVEFRAHAGWTVLVLGLFLSAVMLGGSLGASIQDLRNAREVAGPATYIKTLKCTGGSDGSVEALGFVSIDGTGARALSPSDFILEVGPGQVIEEGEPEIKEARLLGDAWADANSQVYVVVHQSAPQLVKVRSKMRKPAPKDAYCRLLPNGRWADADSWGMPIETTSG